MCRTSLRQSSIDLGMGDIYPGFYDISLGICDPYAGVEDINVGMSYIDFFFLNIRKNLTGERMAVIYIVSWGHDINGSRKVVG